MPGHHSENSQLVRFLDTRRRQQDFDLLRAGQFGGLAGLAGVRDAPAAACEVSQGLLAISVNVTEKCRALARS